MPILESIINKTFWLSDALRNYPVKQHLDNINMIFDNYGSEASVRAQKANLHRLLQHATRHTPFYKEFSGSLDLRDFPVIDKNLIRENYANFSSSAFRPEQVRAVSTSGSTGTPFRVLQDKGKIIRNQADNICFMNRTQFPLGGRMYFLRIWNDLNRMKPWIKFFRNIRTVEASDLSEEKTMEFIYRLQADSEARAILAYGSTLEALVNNLESLGISQVKSALKVIYTMSEGLNDTTKEKLKQIFNCPVYSRYSNAENGFLAHQHHPDSNEYMINTASYQVEFLGLDNDKPVKDGEMGRIVVTDLFNYAMPMIRYDTGDIAVKSKNAGTGIKVPVIERIEGRKLDFIYNTEGKLLSPHVIDYAVRRFEAINKFQFMQLDEQHYRLKLANTQLNEETEASVITHLKNYLGENANIRIEYVEEIPPLASGKYKLVVNLMGEEGIRRKA